MVIDLSSIYQSIALKAFEEGITWPESNDFVKCLDRIDLDSDTESSIVGCYKATSFTDNQGPFGIMALFNEQQNSHVLPLINELLTIFDKFVDELNDILVGYDDSYCSEPSNSSASSDKTQPSYVGVLKSAVPHLTINVYQEHPKILPEDDCKFWRPTAESTLYELAAALDETLKDQLLTSHHFHPMVLQLDSILLTADGAMIAGFIDVDKEHHMFLTMKQLLMDTAKNFFAKKSGATLTSRPKKLIHITLGRILWIDESGLKSNDSSRLQELVRMLLKKYNEEKLPRLVCDMKEHKSFVLTDISFLRNQVWLCVKNTIYKTWSFKTNCKSLYFKE